MKTLLSLTIVALTLLVSIGLLWRSVGLNFVYYLWWKATSTVAVADGVVRSEGSAIHYSVYGAGPPLLLLHGGLSSRLSWFSQLPQLVERGHRVILLDVRGHGRSRLGITELSYRLLAADALQVLDHLGVERADVIGWSDGANTALLLARFRPQRVQRIVAVSANFDPSGLTAAAQRENLERNRGLRYWFYRFWSGAGEGVDELERRLKKLWRQGPRLEAEDLRSISAPVLIILGDQDLIRLDHARAMAELIPASTLEIISGGGHATLITHARQVNRLIEAFLRRHDKKAQP